VGSWPLTAVRTALYADLGLLFGLPLFGLYALRGEAADMLRVVRQWSVALAIAGLGISAFGYAIVVATMSGTTLAEIDRSVVITLLTQTALGWAWIARMAALVLVLGLLALLAWGAMPTRLCMAALTLCGAVAVSTLAWFGHGAASSGVPGWVHLITDIIHLLAASAWIGALVMLLALVRPAASLEQRRIETAHKALAGFSRIGTIIVGIIIATGGINSAFLIGVRSLPMLGSSLYGQLFVAKMLLFMAMLACAALNRFRLTPWLTPVSGPAARSNAFSALRISIAVETILALLVLMSVGWLGSLEPPISTSGV